MLEIIATDNFTAWLDELRDRKGRAAILSRLRRLSLGNPGDVRPIGHGLSEMRINFGPGYRLYCMRRGQLMMIILAGGDKSTQQQDIAHAQRLAADWRD